MSFYVDTLTTKDGVKIFFKDSGSGQPIVFSHGFLAAAVMLLLRRETRQSFHEVAPVSAH